MQTAEPKTSTTISEQTFPILKNHHFVHHQQIFKHFLQTHLRIRSPNPNYPWKAESISTWLMHDVD